MPFVPPIGKTFTYLSIGKTFIIYLAAICRIKELVNGANISDHRIFGDPEKLQNVKLCELHPASWFVPEPGFFIH